MEAAVLTPPPDVPSAGALVLAPPPIAAALAAPVPLDQHPAAIYLASLAAGSRRTMKEALDKIAGRLGGGAWVQRGQGQWDIEGARHDATTFPWQEVRHQHVQAIRAELAERYAPGTANKMLAALKGVLKECWRLGQIDSETYHRAADVASVKGTRVLRGRALDLGEIRALASVCKSDPHRTSGMRDAALIALMYCGGLRRAEAVAISLSDYDAATGAITIRGKGNKERIVYATNGSKDALEAWIAERGAEPGPLFCAVNKGGKMTPGAMTDQAVLYVVQRRAEEAGVKPFTPHDLRRTCASELWDAGVDGSTIQRLLGHESQTTTAKYDRRGERAKKEAAETLYFPF